MSAFGSATKKRKHEGNVMQDLPKIKILNWQVNEIKLPNAVCVRQGTIYSKKITSSDIMIETEDEDGGYMVNKTGEVWVNLNHIKIVANISPLEDIPQSLIEPPAVPFPFIIIQFEINVYGSGSNGSGSIYLYCLVSLRGLNELLPDSSQAPEIDSVESLKEVVSALLGTDAMYQHLKPYLDEFGISKSAITPYELVF